MLSGAFEDGQHNPANFKVFGVLILLH